MDKIKVVEIDGVFVVGRPTLFFEEGDYWIIGYGENEAEALKMAIELIYKGCSKLQDLTRTFVKKLNHKGNCDLLDDLFCPHVEYKDKQGTFTATEFSYDKEHKEWLFYSDLIENIQG